MSLDERSVLVCGPDPDLLDLICSRLRRLGCRVRPTQCVAQAAAYAANESFALAVVDGQSPTVGDRSLPEHLAGQPRAVRVIVLVDQSAAADRDTRLDAGADGHSGPAFRRVARSRSWRELDHAVHEAFDVDLVGSADLAIAAETSIEPAFA